MTLKWCFLFLMTASIISCSTRSNDLFTPPVEIKSGTTTESAKITVQEPNRDVDILFVIDQSASMASIIKEVHANIDQFVKAFTEDEIHRIKFRIGVITAWDTLHFEKTLRLQYKNNLRPPTLGLSERPNLNFDLQQGRLHPLITEKSSTKSLPPYISYNTFRSNDQLIQTLRNTLKVDAEIYRYEIDNNGQLRNVYELTQNYANALMSDTQDAQGNPIPLFGPSPENEEFFGPIYKMTSNQGGSLYNSVNQRFPNPKASQLAVFIITDAEDDVRQRTSILVQENGVEKKVALTPEALYQHLVNFMGNDSSKVAIYGALFESGRDQCQVRALDNKGQFIIDPHYIEGFVAANGVAPNIEDTPFESFVFTNKKRDPGLSGDYRAPKKIERLITLSELMPLTDAQLIEILSDLNQTIGLQTQQMTRQQLVNQVINSGYKSKNIKSICSDDFGAELANVGFRIKERVLQQENVTIDLKDVYDINSLQVYYGHPEQGGTLIPHSTENGWSFVTQFGISSLIEVNHKAYTYQKDLQFHVFYNRLSFINQKLGH